MRWKDRIPRPWRLTYQLWRKAFRDTINQTIFAKPEKIPFESELPFQLELEQIVNPSYLFENKFHNIELAGQRIEQIPIRPSEVFSFWRAIGAPSGENGFKKGRNLINGKLTEDYGGGLCQLSGLLYHLALLGGLSIIERHAHSVDIYEEHERYTPLGADATVVYGYKDLRIKNPYEFCIGFVVRREEKRLFAYLKSEEAIPQREIQFIRKQQEEGEEVETQALSPKGKKTITVSFYKR
ncbi:MAG: VanW family protein [Saprospiraceae bacterium]|nr:VanW family protein [Saprospiraceae bacterium]